MGVFEVAKDLFGELSDDLRMAEDLPDEQRQCQDRGTTKAMLGSTKKKKVEGGAEGPVRGILGLAENLSGDLPGVLRVREDL